MWAAASKVKKVHITCWSYNNTSDTIIPNGYVLFFFWTPIELFIEFIGFLV